MDINYALACGHTEIYKTLLEKQDIDVNKANNYGWTHLHFAAQGSHRAGIVKILLDKGANVNQANNNCWTPLYVAAREGCVEAVKILLDSGADVNRASNKGFTPLYIAAAYGRTEAVKALIESKKIDVNKASNYGRTPFCAATRNGHTEIVEILNELRIKRDIEELQALFCPFSYLDLEFCIKIAIEIEENPNWVFNEIEKFLEMVGLDSSNYKDLDLVRIIYTSILEAARGEILELTKIDIFNEFKNSWDSIHGNFLCTSFNYVSDEARKLIELLTKHNLKLEDFSKKTQYFLNEVEIFN